jgi:hypothetical protein
MQALLPQLPAKLAEKTCDEKKPGDLPGFLNQTA